MKVLKSTISLFNPLVVLSVLPERTLATERVRNSNMKPGKDFEKKGHGPSKYFAKDNMWAKVYQRTIV